ncbi:MAG: isopentenyl-diphosphate Delta-isomerase [Patescibacteria group bacterium]
MEERVILVDENDTEIGTMGKLEAHQRGVLHRAFSVFVFDSSGRLMLQKRASNKYHSGGLWTNTCCSHPRAGELVVDAAHRRLKSEMGFDCPLTEVHSLTYRAEFSNGLIEHEYDHMFVGVWDGTPLINSEEVDEWQWMDIEELRRQIAEHPEQYTYWFKIALEDVLKSKLSGTPRLS